MSSVFSSVIARQSAGVNKPLTNPADAGYGNANKRRNPYIDTEVNPRPLPTFPMVDYMDTEASSINNVVLTDKNFKISGRPTDQKTRSALHYQTKVSALHGLRIPRAQLETPARILPSKPANDIYQFNMDQYYKTMASSEYGYRKLDNEVLSRVRVGGRGPQGDLSMMRASGLERDKNTSINASPAMGLTFQSEAAKPIIQTVAPNHKPTKPHLAAARNF